MNNQQSEGASSPSRRPGFLAGLLLGGLVGAVTMLLLAPRTGDQTRSDIQKQGIKLRHQAAESMDDVVTGAGDKVHEFAGGVQKGVDELQQHARSMLGG